MLIGRQGEKQRKQETKTGLCDGDETAYQFKKTKWFVQGETKRHQ